MIQALFLDAAGTLIEPAEPVAETYAQLLSPHLGTLTPAELAHSFRSAIRSAGIPQYEGHPDGHPDGDQAERQWWRDIVELTVGKPVADPVFHHLFEHYAQPQAWRIFPEVAECLSEIRQLGLRAAVVSNFDLRLHPLLKSFGLEFEQVVSSADARARKPSPVIFEHALQLMRLRPEEVLHVGDSKGADLIGAQEAGIRAFLIERPRTDLRDFLEWVRQSLPKG
ncbi:HAD-IA family hydrolase [Haloferula chungangensis]|uniref:HAD-IA family hydrolase n=1 Tax=Haloferula chungangensis TaxID=1048331 RepID=A0ABW2L6Z0_9BACT